MRVVQWMAGLALIVAVAPAAAKDADRGAELYRVHCATCHGVEGTGQGPMAGVLTVQPSDLTTLAEASGGVFPIERVVKRIDGRDPLISHGSPMPVYGFFFEEGKGVAIATPSGQPIMTTQPVADLVAYLQTLQAK